MIDLRLGDCLDVLKALDDSSVDSIVTDPPYGLSFMGKAWDHSVPSAEVWSECLRVLKPGGHLLAFAGTRTQHRMAANIEDAGFEIRDMIAWVYGSGFPKSLDVSKAIDKMDAAEEQQKRRYKFTEWVRSQGVTSRQIDDATGTNMGGHYTTSASQPAIMTREHLEKCRHLFDSIPKWVEVEADKRSVESKNFAKREVVGKHHGTFPVNHINASNFSQGAKGRRQLDITAPATPAACQWEGWGTALKPALEPITVARKPFTGTVACNVLKHGTGALNIDGSRIATDKVIANHSRGAESALSKGKYGDSTAQETHQTEGQKLGRFPANFIHDGSDEAVTLLGDPARYFYCAKASKKDRDEGVAGVAGVGALRDNGRQSLPRKNHHPTVKPTDLMRYLVRLVTPPQGIVLDPFMGSGSTGKGAVLEGFSFIGIELDADYLEIARARIAAVNPDEVFK